MLLGLEAVHVDRQFRGRNNVGKENKFPTSELGAIAQIEIFAKSVVLPAARLLDARAAPKAGCAVEIKKASAAAPRRLLKQKMAVQKHGLHPRQERIASIQMPPAGLDHADFRIGEKMDRLLKQVWRRDEIGIENANKLTGSRFETDCERTGLESGPVDAMNQLNIEAALPQFFGARSSHLARIVGRIVQHLDLQTIARVIQFADRAQQSLDHINFVEDGQLHGHDRQFFKSAGRHGLPFPILEKKVNNKIAVDAVSRKADEHAEITDCPDE